jgi:hypothetical protein
MKNCAFTICSKSYIALALSLEQSFLKYHNDINFFIVIADYIDNSFDLSSNILEAKNIISVDNDTFEQMSFKYNITEFCTSIKPFCFEYFFNNNFDFVSYLDPDILFFSKFNELYFQEYSIYLTPHILTIEEKYSGDVPENNILMSGTYNCGFIAIRNDNNGKKIISWWKNRLINNAFMDSANGIYTDQKCIEYIPSFIELKYIFIIRNLGCNISYWNYYERKLITEDEKYYISSRIDSANKYLLCFSHFSGFNYLKLLNGIIENKYISIEKYNDIIPLIENYSEILRKNNHSNYGLLKNNFNNYDNGISVLDIHRKIFKRLLQNNIIYKSPFSTENNSFYKLLKKYHIFKNSIFLKLFYYNFILKIFYKGEIFKKISSYLIKLSKISNN